MDKQNYTWTDVISEGRGTTVTPNRPLISVVIPHLNQPKALEACLASLDAQSLERHLFEIIVVDNGSLPIPRNIVANHSGTRLLCELQPGPGPARNCGIQHATGDILAFIDADCRADPEWLRTAQETLCSSPIGTILGGDVRIGNDNGRSTAIAAYESVFGYRFKLYIEQHGFCGTGNLVVRRADFDKIGAFAGIQFAEDMEWGQRARAAGCKFLYVSEMIVFHPARRSLQELYLKWDRHIQHFLNMARERPGWKIRWIARALAVLGSPILDFAKVLSSDRIQGVSSRLQAISVLFAIRTHRALKMLSLLSASKGVVWNRDIEA
jgi:glycosyltransferase involved in cell wall biosynthesis